MGDDHFLNSADDNAEATSPVERNAVLQVITFSRHGRLVTKSDQEQMNWVCCLAEEVCVIKVNEDMDSLMICNLMQHKTALVKLVAERQVVIEDKAVIP